MIEQPNLFDDRTVLAEPKLTARQQAVYDLVAAHPNGVSADEAGACAHELRERNPHGRDERCEWDEKDGRSILDALVKKGLIRRRQGGGHFLYCPATTVATAPEAREGFDEHGFPTNF